MTERTIDAHGEQWALRGWQGGEALDEALQFADGTAAWTWVARFRSEPLAMVELRSLVVEQHGAGAAVARWSDAQVLAETAALLRRSALLAYRVTPAATGWRETQSSAAGAATTSATPAGRASSSAAASQARAAASAAQAALAQAAAQASEESVADMFSPRTDAATTAKGLRNAAKTGAPFCEECAKAAATRAAAADRKAA